MNNRFLNLYYPNRFINQLTKICKQIKLFKRRKNKRRRKEKRNKQRKGSKM